MDLWIFLCVEDTVADPGYQIMKFLAKKVTPVTLLSHSLLIVFATSTWLADNIVRRLSRYIQFFARLIDKRTFSSKSFSIIDYACYFVSE